MPKIAFTAPHFAASEVGLELLKNGANAIDAMIGAAAAITVAYPHMNALGGDSFWLVSHPGETPVAIDGAGIARSNIAKNRFGASIPTRGTDSCITLPGTVAGWQKVREVAGLLSSGHAVPMAELLAPACQLARRGVAVTESLTAACRKLANDVTPAAAFATLNDVYLNPVLREASGQVYNLALADTLEYLGHAGLDDFYRGDIAQRLVADANNLGMDLQADDLNAFHASLREPLATVIQPAKVYNLPAPTQGVASLIILALFDRLYTPEMSEEQQVHLLVEATKQAFVLRDLHLADPTVSQGSESEWLEDAYLDSLAAGIAEQAQPWPRPPLYGDTVWMGCVDRDGLMVSFIQSIYWEFGSGVMLPSTGIIWNNRGCSFSLAENHPNVLAPGKKPLHTLNPAYAELNDGRRLVYGTMGGEGQPQTQAALFSRFVYGGEGLAEAIARDRWLLGRTWGESSTDLKLEPALAKRIGKYLTDRGHQVQALPAQSEIMGHAGAICLAADGNVESATDPRSDGAALVERV